MNLNHVTLIVTDLERSVRFYETLGVEMIVHAPPRYARFTCPKGVSTFSIEVTEHACEVTFGQSEIYFECEDLDAVHARLSKAGLRFALRPTDMPYLWREARLLDPDGHDIRLYRAGENRLFPPWRITGDRRIGRHDVPEHRAGRIWYAPFRRDRRELLHLFKLADDSDRQIAANLYLGEIISAAQDHSVLGYAQVVETGAPREFELKSIAVLQTRQHEGIGSKLLRAAIRYCQALEGRSLKVATSIAASDAIAFYLAHGFRVSRTVRDAFTRERGYPASISGGIPLNDAVEFELMLAGPPSRRRRRRT